MADALELCRWTYNETLAIRKNAYEQEDKSIISGFLPKS
jgi:putative transposase